jgi:hypothetical protein
MGSNDLDELAYKLASQGTIQEFLERRAQILVQKIMST